MYVNSNTGSMLISHLALPAPVALEALRQFPTSYYDLITSASIHSTVWDSVPLDEKMFQPLVSRGSQAALQHLVDSDDMSASFARARALVFSVFYLPADTAKVLLRKLPPILLGTVAAGEPASFPHDQIIDIARRTSLSTDLLRAWTSRHQVPTSLFPDDAWLSMMCNGLRDSGWPWTIVSFETQVTAIGSRPHLLSHLIRAVEPDPWAAAMLLPARALLTPADGLEKVKDDILRLFIPSSERDDLTLHMQCAARVLASRWEVSGDLADEVLACTGAPAHVRRFDSSSGQDLLGEIRTDVPFTDMSPKSKLQIYTTLSNAVETLRLGRDALERTAIAFEMSKVLADQDLVHSIPFKMQARMYRQFRMLWQDLFTTPMPSVLGHISKLPPLEPFVTVDHPLPKQNWDAVLEAFVPDDEWWESNRAYLCSRWRPSQMIATKQRFGLELSPQMLYRWLTLSSWLVSQFGDGSTEASLDTWMSFLHLASVAPDDRTFSDLVRVALKLYSSDL